MIFKCKSCGGNVLYDPEQGKMHCPYCDGEETQEQETQEQEAERTMETCENCGAPLEPGEYRSAVKCEYCGHYTIYEERTSDVYLPRFILPFRLGKKGAQTRMEAELKRRVFAPDSFLSQSSVEKMEGNYVPFWLYDIKADCRYSGTGTKVRVWRRGDTEYTETSYYQIHREMQVDFDKIPVDASLSLPDEVMDLMEPYQYEEMRDFAPKYMSGFLGEVYNQPAGTLKPRAEEKARADARAQIQSTIAGYAAVIPQEEQIDLREEAENYALLPVWWYRYRYKEKDYDCFVNGQTGKVVGKAPVSPICTAVYGGTFFLCLSAILFLLKAILEVI